MSVKKKFNKLLRHPVLFFKDMIIKRCQNKKQCKKIKKLYNNPVQFTTDFLKKRPVLKNKLEDFVEKIPLSSIHYKLYKIYKKQGFNVKSEKSLRKAIFLSKKPIYLYELGIRLKQKKQWWQAVDAFKEAIALSKEVPRDWYKEYALVLMQMNRYKDASLAWEKFIETSKDANDWFMYADSLRLSEQKEKYKTAVAMTISLDKKYNAKKYGIGIFYEKKGRWIEARDAYELQVEKKPLDADLRYRYALALDRCYEWEKAEAQYENAIALKPENSDWYYRLGFVRERQEKYDEAAEAYMYAATNRKTHTPYWFYRLGYVLDKAGHYQEATDAFLMMKKIKRKSTYNAKELVENFNEKFVELILNDDSTKNDIVKFILETNKLINMEVEKEKE